MVNSKDVIRPNLSVREGIGNLRTLLSIPHLIICFQTWRWALLLCRMTRGMFAHCFAEIVVSGGMSMPQILSTLDPQTILGDRTGASRSWVELLVYLFYRLQEVKILIQTSTQYSELDPEHNVFVICLSRITRICKSSRSRRLTFVDHHLNFVSWSVPCTAPYARRQMLHSSSGTCDF